VGASFFFGVFIFFAFGMIMMLFNGDYFFPGNAEIYFYLFSF